MADIYQDDGDLERDIKFDAWINHRKYRIITAQDLDPQRHRAQIEGIEVLIIKDTTWKKAITT